MQVLLLGLTSDLQPVSELPLDAMIEVKSEEEDKQWMIHLLQHSWNKNLRLESCFYKFSLRRDLIETFNQRP